MPINQRFLIVKEKDKKEITYFEYDKIKGYNITPKNNIKFKDAINVNKMVLINPSLIEKLIDKKIKRKFEYMINLLSVIYNNDDDSGDSYYLALDELERLRMEIINKYKNYIKQEKMDLLMKKMDILEDELKLRIKYLEHQDTYSMEGKSR